MDNPFTPTFGAIPLHMAGRKHIVDELSRALKRGAGDPNLVTILSGARGTGKTALLSLLSQQASSEGWIAVNVSALPGMLEEIVQQTRRAAAHLIDANEKTRVSGVHLGKLIDLELQKEPLEKPTWRIYMAELCDALVETDTGLLITVDEVRPDLDEMVQLASAFQHFVRENRKIALFMAGLPTHISSLLQDKSVSFLRRANYYELGTVDDFEVEQALRHTIDDGGRSIAPDALTHAVAVTSGFPYMLQLIGYRSWDQSPQMAEVTLADVEMGLRYAHNDMQRKIFDTTFKELSKGDVRFLAAMLPDKGDSTLADVAERMGKKSNYASQYKRRLMGQGVLMDCGQGYLRIAIPLFKDYLKERLA